MRRVRLSPEQYRQVTVVACFLLAFIIVTGAAVRLTGSGLGCPEWPNCTAGSLTPTAEVGGHGWIEFVNRMVTGLVSIAVIVAVLGSLARTPRRRDLLWLSLGLVVGVIAQALLGALVVKKLLAPPFVMGHFLLSTVLLANALVLVWRAGVPDGEAAPITVPTAIHRLAIAIVAVASAVLVTGTIVTGAGPHSGDAGNSAKVSLRATRLNLRVSDVARVHGGTVIAFCGLVLVLLFVLTRTRGDQRLYRRVSLLLVLIVAQGAIGYIQYFNNVPPALVVLHVAGATAVFSAAVGVLLACRSVSASERVAGSPSVASAAL
ncbi:MAG: heme A synthase [Acidimicrobiia bacterium]|nr:heme A synthase [Acidimicrobiia bacterium]